VYKVDEVQKVNEKSKPYKTEYMKINIEIMRKHR
jgi:hypothetical protein